MNICVTENCPKKCAWSLDNKRVQKMALESTQMLCAALNETAGFKVAPYKTTHKNHNCNIWARTSTENWHWLWQHGKELCKEYTFRYGKVHKCEAVLDGLLQLPMTVPDGPLTPFANCAAHKGLGLSYKAVEPVTEAYRLYLTERWKNDKRTPIWTKRIDPRILWWKKVK